MPKKNTKKKAVKKKTATRKSPTKKADAAASELLVELGTEELPPKSLKALSQHFGRLFFEGLLNAAVVESGDTPYQVFATPRRLTVRVAKVLSRQPDRQVERRGPALQAAYDENGNPTKALLGFAKSCQVPETKLQRLETEKGTWLVHRSLEKGQPLAILVPDILNDVIKKLPIPKRMRWSDLDVEFVRPVHWLVLLHGKKLLKTELLSVTSGRRSQGHRFIGKPVMIPSADKYESLLERHGKVIADFDRRRQLIADKLQAFEKTIGTSKHRARILDQDLPLTKLFPGQKDQEICKNARFCLGDEALLDEVTALVEYPEVYLGKFDDEFLQVPIECLSISMKQHQKYFPVFDSEARLLPKFVIVSNLKPRSAKHIIEGNEKVLRARLSDAKFFFDQDRKVKLEAHVDALKEVTYHQKLGTQLDRVNRTKKLAREIAVRLEGGKLTRDVDYAERAAHLCKADLLTGMVGEFPELQGIMGKYYALLDGEPQMVADAIETHYYPRFAGDDLPNGTVAVALALADKLDTLAGIFWAGEIPTGDKDPYGLRRLALGALRILIERDLDLNLMDLLVKASEGFDWKIDLTVPHEVRKFMMERLRGYYHDAGITPDVFESVLVCKPDSPSDFDKRVRAVMAFGQLREAESLTAANKRVSNILKQANGTDELRLKTALLQEQSEKELAAQVELLGRELTPLFENGDYTPVMKRLAELRPKVDDFFDQVMVMAEDKAIRDNRLALLSNMRQLFLRVADLSKLQGQA